MAVVVARARALVRARAVARTRSECSDNGKGDGVIVEWLWIGGGESKGVPDLDMGDRDEELATRRAAKK